MPIKQNRLVLLLLGLIPLGFWLYKYLNGNLWYDEVYSFEHHVLVDFRDTLFNYPLPNNHVFYNFINQLISRITLLRDPSELSEFVFIFRGFQMVITLFIGWYSWQILKRFFKLENSLLILPLLFTTIPFINFSLQLRGYNLSALFLVMIVYYAWRFIENSSRKNRNFLIVSSALLLYTIPSNIYVLASVLFCFGIFWLYSRKKNPIQSRLFFQGGLFICLGIIISLVLYAPILNDVIFNPFSSLKPESKIYSLELMLELHTAFLSKRYLLLVLFGIGIWFFFRSRSAQEKLIFLSLISLLIFPFLASFIHQKMPFDRVFVTLAPIFCIVLAIPILHILERLKQNSLSLISTIVVSCYCIALLFLEINTNNHEVKNSLVKHGTITQNVYQNYFLSDAFNLEETARHLSLIAKEKSIYLVDQIDYPTAYFYLGVYKLNYLNNVTIPDIAEAAMKNGEVYIITTFKSKTLNQLRELRTLKCTVVSDKYPFSTIISVTKR